MGYVSACGAIFTAGRRGRTLQERGEAFRGLPSTSEGCPQSCIEGARPRRTHRARVRKWRVAIGKIGDSTSVEEPSVGRIAVVEDIVRSRVNLERFVDLIGGMEVENRIRRQPLRLIGFVADKVLRADEKCICSDLKRIGNGIIDAGLYSASWDCWNPSAWTNLDVTADVSEGAVGTDLQSVKESRVHKGIAGVELECGRPESDFGLDALAARRTDVLEIAESLQDRTGNREDVVCVFRTENPGLPSERADGQVFRAAQASFHRARHDLFQRRIGDEECCDGAGMRRIGAAQFQRSRRTVSFRIARIGRQSGKYLIGAANDRIKAV